MADSTRAGLTNFLGIIFSGGKTPMQYGCFCCCHWPVPKTIPSHHYFPPHRSCFALDSSTASRCRESPCWKGKIIIRGEITFKNQNWLKVVTYPWLTECAQNWTLKVGQRLPQLPFLQITRSLCTPISNTASISTNATNIPPNDAIFFFNNTVSIYTNTAYIAGKSNSKLTKQITCFPFGTECIIRWNMDLKRNKYSGSMTTREKRTRSAFSSTPGRMSLRNICF